MAELKTVILFIVIACFDSILTGQVRVREVKEKEREEARESNEYDLKSIFNFLQSQDSKEKKDKTSIHENDEQHRTVKMKEREYEEIPSPSHHIKLKEKENEEPRHVKIKEINHRRNKEKENQERKTKDETENTEFKTPNPKKGHRERGFSKIAPTVVAFATPKITSIKKWKHKTKSREEDLDVSKSFADEDRIEKKMTQKIKERKHKNKDKRHRTGDKKSREFRSGDKKANLNNLYNDFIISKEINMTKSFKSDQPVDIIVHIKMKN